MLCLNDWPHGQCKLLTLDLIHVAAADLIILGI